MTTAALLCCCGDDPFEPPTCCVPRVLPDSCGQTAGTLSMIENNPVFDFADAVTSGGNQYLGDCTPFFENALNGAMQIRNGRWVLVPPPMPLIAFTGDASTAPVYERQIGPPEEWGYWDGPDSNPSTWPPTWFPGIPFCGTSFPPDWTADAELELFGPTVVDEPGWLLGSQVDCAPNASWYTQQWARVTYASSVTTDPTIPFGQYRTAVRVTLDYRFRMVIDYRAIAEQCEGGLGIFADNGYSIGSIQFNSFAFSARGYVLCGTDPASFFCDPGVPFDACPLPITWTDGEHASPFIPQSDLFRSQVNFLGDPDGPVVTYTNPSTPPVFQWEV